MHVSGYVTSLIRIVSRTEKIVCVSFRESVYDPVITI